METTKKDRPIHQTTHYRNDRYRFWERLKRRKPSRYLVLPQIDRPEGNPADSHVLKTLNFLLKHMMERTFGNEFPASGRKRTTILHTAFRLTLEEDPALAIPPKINCFEDNGHTSPDQLRNTYLRYIDAERTARESRQTIGEGKWTMVKRTDKNYKSASVQQNNCDTSIKYVQDHYEAKRATDALATDLEQLKGVTGTDGMRDPDIYKSREKNLC